MCHDSSNALHSIIEIETHPDYKVVLSVSAYLGFDLEKMTLMPKIRGCVSLSAYFRHYVVKSINCVPI